MCIPLQQKWYTGICGSNLEAQSFFCGLVSAVLLSKGLAQGFTPLLSTVGRDLSAGLGLFLDFWYRLVVPEAEYVER
jgi:hypothetical protein